MKKRSMFYLIGVIALICLFVWYSSLDFNEIDLRDSVKKIVSVGQSYDGEYVDRLAELGEEAVPAIAAEMLSAEKFHSKYIRALSRIGSTDAVDPLLSLLRKFDVDPSGRHRREKLRIIDALQKLSDHSAAAALISIMNAEGTHPEVRLAAARSVASIGNSDEKQRARELILDRYGERWSFYNQQGAGFDKPEMNRALMAVGTDESLGYLIEAITINSDTYVTVPIIEYFSTVDQPNITALLISVADQTDSFEYVVRLTAVESLAKHTASIESLDLIDRLDNLEAEAIEDQWPSSFIDRIDAIRSGL